MIGNRDPGGYCVGRTDPRPIRDDPLERRALLRELSRDYANRSRRACATLSNLPGAQSSLLSLATAFRSKTRKILPRIFL